MRLIMDKGLFNGILVKQETRTVNQGKTLFKIENGRIVLMAVAQTIGERVFQQCCFVWETVSIGQAEPFVAIEKGGVAFACLSETLVKQAEVGH